MMKRIISFIIVAVMAFCAILSVLSTMAATPIGTAIKNASEFASMSASGKYYLANDITISVSYENTFSGTLDGNGYKITIAENANISPFNKIEGASFKNLTVEGNINIFTKKTYGGVAAEGYGNFENVTAKVGISAMIEDSFNSVGVSQGCFIGKATGACSFVKCKNEASITVITETLSASNGEEAGFGGFIGKAITNGQRVELVDCENNAAIYSMEPGINVGGFIGVSENTYLNFTCCKNQAFVIGVSMCNVDN